MSICGRRLYRDGNLANTGHFRRDLWRGLPNADAVQGHTSPRNVEKSIRIDKLLSVSRADAFQNCRAGAPGCRRNDDRGLQ